MNQVFERLKAEVLLSKNWAVHRSSNHDLMVGGREGN